MDNEKCLTTEQVLKYDFHDDTSPAYAFLCLTYVIRRLSVLSYFCHFPHVLDMEGTFQYHVFCEIQPILSTTLVKARWFAVPTENKS